MTEELKQELAEAIKSHQRVRNSLQGVTTITPESQLKMVHLSTLETLISVIKARISMGEQDE